MSLQPVCDAELHQNTAQDERYTALRFLRIGHSSTISGAAGYRLSFSFRLLHRSVRRAFRMRFKIRFGSLPESIHELGFVEILTDTHWVTQQPWRLEQLWRCGCCYH